MSHTINNSTNVHFDLKSCAAAVRSNNPAQGSPIEARRQKNTPMKFAGQLHSVPASCVARLQAGLVDRLSYTKMELLSQAKIDRFWSKVRIAGPDDCWIWTAGLATRGEYGRVKEVVLGKRESRAHRVAFLLAGGRFTLDKPQCLHACHNGLCCNPAHLRAGDVTDNMQDRKKAGRANTPTGERHGSVTRPDRVPRGERHPLVKNPELAARGEYNGSAKLTESKVRELRLLRGVRSQRDLAAEYGIDQTTVSDIQLNKSWKHIK